jgi:hypothetical protein
VSEPQLQDAVDMTPGLAYRASFLGWALIVIALAIFGLTFVAALVYLQLD